MFLVRVSGHLLFYTDKSLFFYDVNILQDFCIIINMWFCKFAVNFTSESKMGMQIQFLTRFSTKILVIRLANGGWAVGRAGGRILNGVKLWFPLNNFSLLWPIDTKLGV